MRALISVFDKTGLDTLAKGLASLDWELVASGGTAASIAELGLQVTPVEEMRVMSQSIPGARFVKLDGAGHLSNIETPAAFQQTLIEFLDGMKIR